MTTAQTDDAAFFAILAEYDTAHAVITALGDRTVNNARVFDQAYTRLRSVLDRLTAEPVHTLAGLTVKLRLINHFAQDDWIEQTRRLAASALADAERMTKENEA